jgi:hypothetical protein
MMKEAYTILAMDSVRLTALETNETVLSYFASDATQFCDLVMANGQNTSSALYAGLNYCLDIDTFGQQIFGEHKGGDGGAFLFLFSPFLHPLITACHTYLL